MDFQMVIRGGMVTTADASAKADLGISDGKIIAVGIGLPRGIEEIDATGLLVMPGMIDVHTHFDHMVDLVNARNADDYESGSRAAAAGGITTVVNFAFQTKGHSLREAVEYEMSRAEGNSIIDYGIHQCVTDPTVNGVFDEIPKLADEGFASVKCFTTTNVYQLPDRDVLRLLEVARDNGLLVNCHAEDEALIQHLTQGFLRRGLTSVEYLPQARPTIAEGLATYRAATYARYLKTPIYFVHLSSADALRAVRRVRDEGGEIYVETRPVYLFLDESRYKLPDRQGNLYVCLPPLRPQEDQAVLWDGLRNGEIQTYATDHAPWKSEQKLDPARADFTKLPAGVSNVQTSIGMLYSEGVSQRRISASQLVAVGSTNPAKLFGMWPNKGTLAPGFDADVVLIDPALRVEVQARDMYSASDYDPYEGYNALGWPVLTMLRGQVIARDGRVTGKKGNGRFLKRSRFQPL
jgi:dihydropyrimidinase